MVPKITWVHQGNVYMHHLCRPKKQGTHIILEKAGNWAENLTINCRKAWLLKNKCSMHKIIKLFIFSVFPSDYLKDDFNRQEEWHRIHYLLTRGQINLQGTQQVYQHIIPGIWYQLKFTTELSFSVFPSPDIRWQKNISWSFCLDLLAK